MKTEIMKDKDGGCILQIENLSEQERKNLMNFCLDHSISIEFKNGDDRWPV